MSKRLIYYRYYQVKLVEAAGIEPASASTPPSALHAYPIILV